GWAVARRGRMRGVVALLVLVFGACLVMVPGGAERDPAVLETVLAADSERLQPHDDRDPHEVVARSHARPRVAAVPCVPATADADPPRLRRPEEPERPPERRPRRAALISGQAPATSRA
ncbi:hypothetical protein ACSNOI_39920, partial [Actinomadura kijaniata]|uniref:hypothetical protein n=1 Tax=Actinomadura kijaniata TaxID=46161 RepID=UPI003F1BD240